MKTKKLNKKLIFNKVTVTNLSKKEMQEQHGGLTGDCTRKPVNCSRIPVWTWCIPVC